MQVGAHSGWQRARVARLSVRGEPPEITPSPTSIVINKRLRARGLAAEDLILSSERQARDKRLKATKPPPYQRQRGRATTSTKSLPKSPVSIKVSSIRKSISSTAKEPGSSERKLPAIPWSRN